MPKYYHVHRGIKPSNLENKFIENQSLFFSKKKSGWYIMEKDISKDYGGYRIYEIYIPASRFTTSFTPTKKNKIFKVTKNNVEEYTKLFKSGKMYQLMKTYGMIGIDGTFVEIYGPGEGFIKKKTTDIIIKLVDIIKLN